jgi:hypothetical protein
VTVITAETLLLLPQYQPSVTFSLRLKVPRIWYVFYLQGARTSKRGTVVSQRHCIMPHAMGSLMSVQTIILFVVVLWRLMNSGWDWIIQNKHWVFSGVGITAFGVGWWLIKKLFAWNYPGNPLPDININVSPTISPTFSPNQSNTIQNTISGEGRLPAPQPEPDIKAVTYKAVFAEGLDTGRNCFVISFRNDGRADATNVIAHIQYGKNSSSPEGFLVDYGGWIEHTPVTNIPRGHTKNLIIAVTENGKNFAVNDIAPATNYTRSELVNVGEITRGLWLMVVTLSADNFRINSLLSKLAGIEERE